MERVSWLRSVGRCRRNTDGSPGRWADYIVYEGERYGMDGESVECFDEGLRRRRDVVGVVLCA